MYELKHGTARLIGALHRRADNLSTLTALSRLLNYNPDQLREDIRAAADYYDKTKDSIEEKYHYGG